MRGGKDWYRNVKREAMLFMAESDPPAYDHDFWLDYFEKTKVDTVNLCAGGIVAFYPTKLRFQRKSKWMGSGDPFGGIAKAVRERGLNLIARIDPHATHREAYEEHPEWIACDKSGNPRRHWANPELWVTCVMGPYYDDFITEVVKEITAMYMVDGFHVNRWTGSGICYCEHCRKEFFDYCGLKLPTDDNKQDDAWDFYNKWLGIKQLHIWDNLNETVQKINPNGYFYTICTNRK